MGCLNLPIEYYIGNRSKYDYVNDAIGRRTSMAKSGTAFTQSDTISYGYNDRSEVTSATATSDTTYNFGFAFDNIGNRSTYTTNETGSAVTSAYTSNNLNQYTAITNPTRTPTYDDDGNMLTNGDWTYTWNAENRLIQAVNGTTILEFKYDYMGRRIEKKVTDKVGTIWTQSKYLKFVYNGYKLVEVLDGANSDAVLQKIVWDGDKPLSIYDASLDTTYYYVLDANKNVSGLIDSSGNTVAHYEYSPFGKIVRQTGTYANTNPLRFSSEYCDYETGLVYYNFRYYCPELGRWLKKDPIAERGGLNLYGMLDNNSVNKIDYLGHEFMDWVVTGDWNAPSSTTSAAIKEFARKFNPNPLTFTDPDASTLNEIYTDTEEPTDEQYEAATDAAGKYARCYADCMKRVNKKGLAAISAGVGAVGAVGGGRIGPLKTPGTFGTGPGHSDYTSYIRQLSERLGRQGVSRNSLARSGLRNWANAAKRRPLATAFRASIAAAAIAETAAAVYCSKKCKKCECPD